MTVLPRWFYLVAALALAWNLIGCLAFVADLRLTPDDLAAMPAAQQALYRARPAWSVAATAVAVIGGALGCLALLLRRRIAFVLLVASLLALVVQDASLFALLDGARAAGGGAVAMQALVLAVAIALVQLARRSRARGWLR